MDIGALNRALKFIDSWLDFRQRHDEIPGLVVGISHNNELVFNKAYGYANLERKEKLRSSHIFRIGLTSKNFYCIGNHATCREF